MARSLWSNRSEFEATPPEVVAAIEGSHLLVERFGLWPSFADFEIVSLAFDRGNLMETFQSGRWSEMVKPNLTATFHGFDSRRARDDPDRKPSVITLRFWGTFERFAFDGFNHQNPIVGLEVIFEWSANLKRNLFAVDWGGTAIQHDVSFSCERMQVVSVGALVS